MKIKAFSDSKIGKYGAPRARFAEAPASTSRRRGESARRASPRDLTDSSPLCFAELRRNPLLRRSEASASQRRASFERESSRGGIPPKSPPPPKDACLSGRQGSASGRKDLWRTKADKRIGNSRGSAFIFLNVAALLLLAGIVATQITALQMAHHHQVEFVKNHYYWAATGAVNDAAYRLMQYMLNNNTFPPSLPDGMGNDVVNDPEINGQTADWYASFKNANGLNETALTLTIVQNEIRTGGEVSVTYTITSSIQGVNQTTVTISEKIKITRDQILDYFAFTNFDMEISFGLSTEITGPLHANGNIFLTNAAGESRVLKFKEGREFNTIINNKGLLNASGDIFYYFKVVGGDTNPDTPEMEVEVNPFDNTSVVYRFDPGVSPSPSSDFVDPGISPPTDPPNDTRFSVVVVEKDNGDEVRLVLPYRMYNPSVNTAFINATYHYRSSDYPLGRDPGSPLLNPNWAAGSSLVGLDKTMIRTAPQIAIALGGGSDPHIIIEPPKLDGSDTPQVTAVKLYSIADYKFGPRSNEIHLPTSYLEEAVFWDFSLLKNVRAYHLDMGLLMQYLQSQSPPPPPGGIIYINTYPADMDQIDLGTFSSQMKYAVVLKNAQALNGNYTIVTPGGLYVRGDVNTIPPENQSPPLPPINPDNPGQTYDVALIADYISVLSNEFPLPNGYPQETPRTNRPVNGNVTINAALIQGGLESGVIRKTYGPFTYTPFDMLNGFGIFGPGTRRQDTTPTVPNRPAEYVLCNTLPNNSYPAYCINWDAARFDANSNPTNNPYYSERFDFDPTQPGVQGVETVDMDPNTPGSQLCNPSGALTDPNACVNFFLPKNPDGSLVSDADGNMPPVVPIVRLGVTPFPFNATATCFGPGMAYRGASGADIFPRDFYPCSGNPGGENGGYDGYCGSTPTHYIDPQYCSALSWWNCGRRRYYNRYSIYEAGGPLTNFHLMEDWNPLSNPPAKRLAIEGGVYWLFATKWTARTQTGTQSDPLLYFYFPSAYQAPVRYFLYKNHRDAPGVPKGVSVSTEEFDVNSSPE